MRKTITNILIAAMAVVSVSAYAAPNTNAEMRRRDKDNEDARVTVEHDLNGVTSVTVKDIVVNHPVIEHNGDYIKVEMELDLTGLKVRQNRAVLITPHVLGPLDTLDLSSVGIYGRRRWFYYQRMGKGFITDNEESYRVRRKPRKPDTIDYSEVVDYAGIVGEGELKLHIRRALYGCCGRLKNEIDAPLYAEKPAYYPNLIYIVPPVDAVKERSLSGSANIEYVVDKTDIRPSYRNNVAELRKITGLIDTTFTDTDFTISRLFLKGYASPEDTYKHNTDLAMGRVASLKDYVQELYHFDDGIIETDYEPEDWAGLRKFVEESKLKHRDEILALIDTDMDIDAKEKLIHSRYPEDYKYLLEHCYPTLRHTFYEVSYIIREYSDIDEIREVYAHAPGKLSLGELYLLAESYEPGSAEFDEIFDMTVRLYPDDPSAELNAANAAIRSFNFDKARAYLEKVGESPEAEYALGVCDYWAGDYESALEHFHHAYDSGLEQALEVIETFENSEMDVIDTSRKTAIQYSENYSVHEARLAEESDGDEE